MAEPDTTPCAWCDQPREGHGTRYTAGRGLHEWEEPQVIVAPLPAWRIRELTDTK